jgi:hypothetical protein
VEELIRRFARAGVRYLVIGGQAVRLEGMPRFSMDWDIHVPPHNIPEGKTRTLSASIFRVPVSVPFVPS